MWWYSRCCCCCFSSRQNQTIGSCHRHCRRRRCRKHGGVPNQGTDVLACDSGRGGARSSAEDGPRRSIDGCSRRAAIRHDDAESKSLFAVLVQKSDGRCSCVLSMSVALGEVGGFHQSNDTTYVQFEFFLLRCGTLGKKLRDTSRKHAQFQSSTFSPHDFPAESRFFSFLSFAIQKRLV